MKKAIDIITQNFTSLQHNKTFEYKLLLSEILGYDVRGVFIKDILLSNDQETKFLQYLKRMESGEPVSKIIGKTEFYGFLFHINKNVLDPRQDSETLIDAVLSQFDASSKVEILELGVGSGCLIISLLKKLPLASGVGVDISEEALCVAKQNTIENGVDNRLILRISNWFNNVDEHRYDIIVSNPPYIKTSSIAWLDDTVTKYDPILALDGGESGLVHYERIFQVAKDFLKKQGKIFVEIGEKQFYDVSIMAFKCGLRVVSVHKDCCAIDRVVSFGIS